MSEKESSSEEELRPNRSQQCRRTHDMSFSSAEEGMADDINNFDREEEADSAEESIAKVSTRVQTSIHNNALFQDMSGPQLSKEGFKNAMKGAKRVDEVAPNVILKEEIVSHYHKVRCDYGNFLLMLPHQELLGRGAWAAKAKKKMREKYFVSREQYVKMEAPTLKVKIENWFF